ncbi:MAG: HEAT repeat domain-containing protein [Lewinellaceae bacterium]|nr:HEAT repeat domain-containing protein [Lewinellaceae bacterium]
MVDALQDKFWAIRQKALNRVDPANPAALAAIVKIAENDPEPSVRATAIEALGETGDKQYVPIIQKSLSADQAYSIVGAALSALTKLDPAAAVVASQSLQNDDSDALTATLAELYAQNPDRANLTFFEKRMGKVDYMAAFSFFENYQKFLTGLGDVVLIDSGIENLKAVSLNLETSEFRRFATTKAIADIRNYFREKGDTAKVESLQKILGEIKEKETDSTLKLYYDMFDTP